MTDGNMYPTMLPAADVTTEGVVLTQPHIILTDGGEPADVDNARLVCHGDNTEVFIAAQLSVGKYRFEDAITLPRDTICDLMVEIDG